MAIVIRVLLVALAITGFLYGSPILGAAAVLILVWKWNDL